MVNLIVQLLQSHNVCRFRVVTIHVDIQFKATGERDKLGPLVNFVLRGKYISKIKRMIRVLKKYARFY